MDTLAENGKKFTLLKNGANGIVFNYFVNRMYALDL